MLDDPTAPDLAALAEDENRLERFAPSLVPFFGQRLKHCLLPVLYLLLAIKTGITAGEFLCATARSRYLFWPSSAGLPPMLLECCMVLMLVFCACSVRRLPRLAAWMCWGCVLLRVGITTWETLVRAEFVLRITTRMNDTLFGYCVLMPFEAIAPMVVLAVFASKGCKPAPDSGHCPDCGYSTYGLPDRVCPECGTSLPEPALPAR